jgi:xanthine dehydrogenase accessory factor
MREALGALVGALDAARACVYCSLVETRGSTPQKAGAAMLVFPDGSQQGTLGGGCVEAEVKQRALQVLARGQAASELLTFNLDDDYGWDDGLICGGRMTILADALAGPTSNGARGAAAYYRRLADVIASGAGCTQAVVIDQAVAGAPVGTRILYDAARRDIARYVAGSSPASTLDRVSDEVKQHLLPLAERPRTRVRHGVAYLTVLPRIRLLIAGAGHVGEAVARLAAQVDFDVWVLDDRESYASAARFPSAERRIVGDIGPALRQLVESDITTSTYCLIVTRGHNHDEEALYHLARSRAGYVGMIGSRRKIRLIYDDLLARGVDRTTLARVHAPLGLPIGAQTVPEIAISIVAELIACRNLGPAYVPKPAAIALGDDSQST